MKFWICIDENHPKAPENYYGYSKLAIEENLAWFARLSGLRYASLRYFNATGYDTRPAGEAEVAIWEIAAGTYDKWFALFINLPAMIYGYALWPRRAAAAWRRGRAGHSLYRREFGDDLLEMTTQK